MSVKNPFISELKGLSCRLLNIGKEIDEGVNEVRGLVEEACLCLERILLYGICTSAASSLLATGQRTLLTLISGSLSSAGDAASAASGHTALWHWMRRVARREHGATYSYICAVDSAKKSAKVRTARGHTRLLIRTALVKRCIHIPVQLLGENGLDRVYYKSESILGDEVLREVLLSVVMLWSSGELRFRLQLDNARFLDDTWTLPETTASITPPTPHLGVSVTFVSGMAVVVEAAEYSVATEHAHIQKGDVLDELNGYCITDNHQGAMVNLLRKSAGQPVSVSIIKAEWNGGVFPALVPVLREARVDIDQIVSRQSASTSENVDNSGTDPVTEGDRCSGDLRYFGSVAVGTRSGMKQVEAGVRHFMESPAPSVPVVFEFDNLGVRVLRKSRSDQSENTLLKHYFMEISSCATPSYAPEYFAYIVGEKGSCSPSECDTKPTNFNCHVFRCTDTKEIDSLLRIMGQGFKRTHFTV